MISDTELDRLADNYVAAAAMAYRVGFDFVDLKQCHRYLLNELLAAQTRPGKYGGSFENRTQVIRDVVGRIRDANPGRAHRHPPQCLRWNPLREGNAMAWAFLLPFRRPLLLAGARARTIPSRLTLPSRSP